MAVTLLFLYLVGFHSPLAVLAIPVLVIVIWRRWQANRKTYEPEKVAWAHATARATALWEEAYYCSKHDVVFVPRRNRMHKK
jgi:hypothetical protein